MRTPELRPRAAYDIESIVTYISMILASPRAAEAWYGEFRQKVELLCAQPETGRIFEDDRLHMKECRTTLVGNYRLFYTSNAATLTIWRVLHIKQDIDQYALIDF